MGKHQFVNKMDFEKKIFHLNRKKNCFVFVCSLDFPFYEQMNERTNERDLIEIFEEKK